MCSTKKGIKLLERAAELGDKASQAILVSYYNNGHPSPKCLGKAIYYAEKAVDQGSSTAQCILAALIEDSDSSNCEDEVFQLRTLAAFQ